MELNTRQIFEVTLTPTECENFSEILVYMHTINYLFDAPCLLPMEEEMDFPGFLLTHARLDSMIKTLAKLRLALPMHGGIRQPDGLIPFIASLKKIAFGIGHVETSTILPTQALISA